MDKIVSDIYFDDDYGKLYEKTDDGEAIIFLYESDLGKVKHQFIKRRIPMELLCDSEVLYDIVTPYGYGGPIIIEQAEGAKKQLVQEFYDACSVPSCCRKCARF